MLVLITASCFLASILHFINYFTPLLRAECGFNNDKEVIGKIGNLLPLSQDLNERAKNKSVIDKLPIYQESQYSLPKNFASEYSSSWNSHMIDKRTESLAKLCYRNIWSV